MFLNSAAKVYRVYAAFLHKHFFVMIFLEINKKAGTIMSLLMDVMMLIILKTA